MLVNRARWFVMDAAARRPDGATATHARSPSGARWCSSTKRPGALLGNPRGASGGQGGRTARCRLVTRLTCGSWFARDLDAAHDCWTRAMPRWRSLWRSLARSAPSSRTSTAALLAHHVPCRRQGDGFTGARTRAMTWKVASMFATKRYHPGAHCVERRGGPGRDRNREPGAGRPAAKPRCSGLHGLRLDDLDAALAGALRSPPGRTARPLEATSPPSPPRGRSRSAVQEVPTDSLLGAPARPRKSSSSCAQPATRRTLSPSVGPARAPPSPPPARPGDMLALWAGKTACVAFGKTRFIRACQRE